MRWHFTSFSGKFRAAPMRSPALPSLLLLAFVGALVASVACSSQGEGEFCTMANGNNDCQDGLECMAAPGVTGSANDDRCCPIPPAQPTTAACTRNTGTVIDASTEIPDVISDVGSADVSDVGSADVGSADVGSADVGSDAEAGSAEASAPPTPDAGHADALPE
jgi:hypothetical protein